MVIITYTKSKCFLKSYKFIQSNTLYYKSKFRNNSMKLGNSVKMDKFHIDFMFKIIDLSEKTFQISS